MTDVLAVTSRGENQASPGTQRPVVPAIVTGSTSGGGDEDGHNSGRCSENGQASHDAGSMDFDLDSIITGPLSPVTESDSDETDSDGDETDSDDSDETEERSPPSKRARTWEVLQLLAYDYFKKEYLVLWREVKSMNLTKTVSWEPRRHIVENERDPRLLSTIFWKNRPKKASKKFLRSVIKLHALDDGYSSMNRLNETAIVKKYHKNMYKIVHNGVVLENKQDHEFSAQEALKLYWSGRKSAGLWN